VHRWVPRRWKKVDLDLDKPTGVDMTYRAPVHLVNAELIEMMRAVHVSQNAFPSSGMPFSHARPGVIVSKARAFCTSNHRASPSDRRSEAVCEETPLIEFPHRVDMVSLSRFMAPAPTSTFFNPSAA
jgi:hypothetical protein